jgi:hypothetical protein
MSTNKEPKSLSLLDSFLRNQTPYLQGAIVHADQKATFLIAILGILLSYLISKYPLAEQAVILQQAQGWDRVAHLLILGAVGSLFVGGCFAGLVVWPRFDSEAASKSTAFVSIVGEYPDAHIFESQMCEMQDEEIIRKQLRSHHYRCGVCLKKWLLLQYAYSFSGLGVLLFITHFAWDFIRKL